MTPRLREIEHWGWIMAALMVSSGGAARADDLLTEPSGPWEFSETIDGIQIKTRSVQGTEVRQVYAEMAADGTVAEFRDVVTDVDDFPKFMPYVQEGRIIRKEPPNVEFTYIRLDLPWPLSPRDYATRRVIEHEPDGSGNGEFRSHWSAISDLVPLKPGTVRVVRNDGFWLITTQSPGKIRLQHGFVVDPGGGVPMFAVNYANRKGVPDMLKAILGEVRRRRAAKAGKGP